MNLKPFNQKAAFWSNTATLLNWWISTRWGLLLKILGILAMLMAIWTLLPKSGMRLTIWVGENELEVTPQQTPQEVEMAGVGPSLDVKVKKHAKPSSSKAEVGNSFPSTVEEISSLEDARKAYIARYYKTAQQEQKLYGIPASISLAQGLIESRAGTSKLAKGNNNHFGVKCFARNCKKGHCTNHTDDTHKDFFRKYTTPWESWRDHSKKLSSERYRKLTKKCGKSYRKWAHAIKAAGYATDSRYAQTLISVIEKYELHRFD